VIRINLVRAKAREAAPERALISRREAVTGAVFLAAALAILFYLASQPGTVQAPGPPPPAAAVQPTPAKSVPPEPPAPQPAPARAAAPEPPAPAPGCQVTAVAISADAVVSLRTNTAVKPTSFRIDNPDRIAVDLPGCLALFPNEQMIQKLDHPLVTRVRTSQFQQNPDIVRVVIDLRAPARHELQTSGQGVDIRILEPAP